MVRGRNGPVGFDPSPLLPLGAFMIVMFMVFTPLTMQMMPRVVSASDQAFSFMWVIPLIIVATLFLTSTEMLAPTPHNHRRPAAYNRYSSYSHQSYGESPSWGLLGLMLLMLMLLPRRY
jgi:uncharacterized membrane protein